MRLGIVGCGLIGQKRAAAAARHEIVAVSDLVPARAEALAARTGARVVEHWQDLVPLDLDIVLVATTHDTLAAIARAAVEAGKHVLVEKPGARSLAELQPLVEAARRCDRIVKVGFNHRFHPGFLKAREIVDSGALGPLMLVRGRYGHGGRPGMETEWRCRPEAGGGELIDQGSHLIDLSRWFLGDLTLGFGAALTLFWDIPVDDNCFLALTAVGGAVAWLHASWSEWKNMFCFELYGRDGKLTVDGLGGSYGTEKLTFHRMLPGMGPPETTIWEYPFPDTSWEREFDEFIAAIVEGRRPCGDLADATAMLAVIDQVYGRSTT